MNVLMKSVNRCFMNLFMNYMIITSFLRPRTILITMKNKLILYFRQWGCLILYCISDDNFGAFKLLSVLLISGIVLIIKWFQYMISTMPGSIGKLHCPKYGIKGVGVVNWYLSIPPQNNSGAVVNNLSPLFYMSSLRLPISYLILKI